MTKMNRLLALLLALLMLTLPALAETAPETSPEDVMATVNGTAITRAAYDKQLQALMGQFNAAGYDMTNAEYQKIAQQVAMTYCVQNVLMDAMLVEMNLSLTDEEAADAAQEARDDWNLQINGILAQYGITEKTAEEERAEMLQVLLSTLESVGMTEESYVNDGVRYAGYNKLHDHIVSGVDVTDEEVKAHYDELVLADQIAYENDLAAYEYMQQMNDMALAMGMSEYYTPLYYAPEGYRTVTHILLTADEAALTSYNDAEAALVAGTGTQEAVDAAKAAVLASVQDKVDEINARLAGGETFAALIPEYTTDPGMKEAAAIEAGYQVHAQSTQFVIPFRDAAFTVDEIGEVTAPVVTSFGVHILQYVADVPGGAVEYTADLQALLKQNLLTSRQNTLYNETVQGWIDSAEIVYADEIKSLMEAE